MNKDESALDLIYNDKEINTVYLNYLNHLWVAQRYDTIMIEDKLEVIIKKLMINNGYTIADVRTSSCASRHVGNPSHPPDCTLSLETDPPQIR